MSAMAMMHSPEALLEAADVNTHVEVLLQKGAVKHVLKLKVLDPSGRVLAN